MVSPTDPKRLDSLQALRGFAALAVFLHHLAWMEKLVVPQRLLPPGMGLGAFGVDVFFALSGFIMVHTVMGRDSSPRSAATFLFSRWARIFPAYWAVLIPCFALAALLPGWRTIEPTAPWLNSLLLVPANAKPLLETGWTLIHELYFYSVFACFVLAPRSKLAPLLGLWAAAVIVGRAIWPAEVAGPLLNVAANPLTLEFIAGAFVALLVRSGLRVGAAATLGCGLLGLLAGQIALQLNPSWLGPDLSRPLSVGAPAVLVLYGAAALRPRSTPALRWLARVGDYSYALYLTHLPITIMLAQGFAALALPGYWSNAGYVVATVSSTVLATCLLHHGVERPALAWARRLVERSAAWASPMSRSRSRRPALAQGG